MESNIKIYEPSLIGFDFGVSPKLVVASTVTLMSEEAIQLDDEMSNSSLQTSPLQDMALMTFEPHTVPRAESK